MGFYGPQIRRKGNSMTKLLTLPDKGINSTSGVGGVLARLFRQVLFDLNINTQVYGSLLTSLVKDPNTGVSDNSKDRSSAIGNYSKHFSKPWMSWKKFVEALRLLQFEDVEIILRGKSRLTGRITEHSTKFNLGEYNHLDVEEDDDDADND